MNASKQHPEERVKIPRSVLQGGFEVRNQVSPLVRGKISDQIADDFVEVPVPVTASVDHEEVHVLHVDDDPGVVDLTKACLERVDENFSVHPVTNVVEALAYLGNESVDCIISDYDMPNTNGIEFLEIVREKHSDLPFILFTGKGSEEVASEAIAAGVTDYMQKGMGTDQYELLANRVRNVVEQYRTRQQFWQALSWYQRLVEQDLAGVFIVQDGEFIYANERFADIFGYTQCELVGSSPDSITADEAAGTFGECLEMDGKTSETFQQQFTGVSADGERIDLEVHGGSIQYRGSPGCIGVLWNRPGDE